MEVYVTRHARNRIRLYEISPEAVEMAARNPERVTSAAFGASHAWTRTAAEPETWLRVTFVDDGARRVIITVTPTRHGPGGPDAH